MWIAWMIVGIVAVVVIIAVRAALVGRRSEHGRQPEVLDPERADFPAPGEPSPHRPDGRPVPGSRDDRRDKRGTSS